MLTAAGAADGVGATVAGVLLMAIADEEREETSESSRPRSCLTGEIEAPRSGTTPAPWTSDDVTTLNDIGG